MKLTHSQTSGRRRWSALFAVGAALLAASVAQAVPVVGANIYVQSDGEVIATYRGNSASYSNDLYLHSPSGFPGIIFNNHASPIGSSVSLGFFTAGTELIFRLYVNNTGTSYYTGDASRNPDGSAHARVDTAYATNETLVEFEDLLNGPFAFNDLSFSFTNVGSAPPPPTNSVPDTASTLSLLGVVLAGLGCLRRKRTA